MPRLCVSQSGVDQVPSSVVLQNLATIDSGQPSESVGCSVSNAVDPTTVPVMTPAADPSTSNIVQTPLTTGPTWNNVTVAVLIPADGLVNHPPHVPLSEVPLSEGLEGAVGNASPSSPQPEASAAIRTAPVNRRLARLT